MGVSENGGVPQCRPFLWWYRVAYFQTTQRLRQGKHPGGVQAALRSTGEPNDPLPRRVLPKDLGQALQILAVLLQQPPSSPGIPVLEDWYHPFLVVLESLYHWYEGLQVLPVVMAAAWKLTICRSASAVTMTFMTFVGEATSLAPKWGFP